MYSNWHSHSLSKVIRKLKTSPKKGLDDTEALRRYTKNGPNVLPRKKQLSRAKLLFRQFNNSLMLILLIIIAVSFFIGHYSDSISIFIVIAINTFVGFYQENKVNNSLRVLQEMVSIKVRVIREGHFKEIDSKKLVAGDMVSLSPGDKVPADCRIIESKDLKVNESSLTGEWMAVSKKSDELANETVVSDRYNMLFMGTSVDSGEGLAVVVKTGLETEFGKIVSLVKETEEPQTPLQKKISRLSKIVGAFVIFLMGVIILEGYLTGKDLTEVFIASLALTVSAIPEGLLPAITVILVLAMRRILKKKGVVKKLSAAEGLGSVTVVCSDKTGTLTEGNMEMSHALTEQEELFPNKKTSQTKVVEGQKTSREMALTIAMLTNDAYIENPEDELHEWIVRGYFTDKALLLSGVKSGMEIKKAEEEFPLIERQSFSSHNRYALSLRKSGKKKTLFVVGSPEKLISLSSSVYAGGVNEKLTEKDKDELKKRIDELTSSGLRVIACGYKDVERSGKKLNNLVEELSFVGFIALKDPVRKDARHAITEIRKAGVRPVVITGDHKKTAVAVAREVGINVKSGQVLEGKDIEKMTAAELKKKSKTVAVYARALPEHKLKIVKALHQNNEVVAMFGDGVNDAPALKASDIGVAVGSGTDVAKEVADIILLDDNFKTIVKAIEQGRVAFSNIRKVFIYLVADDFTEIVLFLGAMALGLPLPLLAIQILWINLIEDSFPSISLTMEQETEGVMEEAPRGQDEPILSSKIKWWIFWIFSINSLITFLFFWLVYRHTGDIVQTRTLVFVLMSFDSLAFAYCVRSFKHSVFRKGIFSNKYLNWAVLISFILLLASIYLPSLQSFVGTTALSLTHWGIVLAITFFEIIVIEIAKHFCLRRD